MEKKYNLRNNLWVVWSFFGLAFVSLIYIGIKAKNKKWIIAGVLYMLFFSFLGSSEETESISKDIGSVLGAVLWIVSIFYMFRLKKEYQDLLLLIHVRNMNNTLSTQREKYYDSSMNLWEETFPDFSNNIHARYNIFKGMLSVALIAADGNIDKNETAFMEDDNVKAILNNDQNSLDEFAIGVQFAVNNLNEKGEISEVKLLQISLDDNANNEKTISLLISLAAVDGYVDKLEYDLIKTTSSRFGIYLPHLEDLTDKIGVKSSDIEKEEATRKAKQARANIAKTTAKGVGVVAATAVLAFIGSDAKSSSKGNRSRPHNKTKASKTNQNNTQKEIFSSQHKKCVTCQNWGGSRQISHSRMHAECSSFQVKGECVGGEFNRIQRAAVLSCNKWVKWNVLK